MDINSLRYPKKSHRKRIKIPRESTNLAELMGIEFGDGGISNSWQIVITMNAEKDIKYAQYVKRLIYKLFRITPTMRIRKEKTLRIISNSTSLVDFLVKKGAVRGNKIKQNLDIPNWVLKKNLYKKAFVRGLVDTDGCLYVHRHTTKGVPYKNIGFCFTSCSQNLLNSVADIFHDFGIRPHITDKGRRIYLYGENSVLKYLCVFGSSNDRIRGLYKIWRGARVV